MHLNVNTVEVLPFKILCFKCSSYIKNIGNLIDTNKAF